MSGWSWLRMCFHLDQAARPPGAELPFERVIEAIAQTNGDRNGSWKRISRRRVCRDNY